MFEFSKWADAFITPVFQGFDWRVASRGTLRFQKRILVNGIASGRSSREFLVRLESDLLAELSAGGMQQQADLGRRIAEWVRDEVAGLDLGDASVDEPLLLEVDAGTLAQRD